MDEWPHRLRPAEDDSEDAPVVSTTSSGVSTGMNTPRRFLIRNRDNLAQILVEGVVWSHGGVSTVLHSAPWFKDSRGLSEALPEELGLPHPHNLSQLENLAAAAWGELDWLDKTDEELQAAAQAQADLAAAAWKEATESVHEDVRRQLGLDWRDPVAVAREQRVKYSFTGDSEIKADSRNESGSDKAEEDSEPVFAPGTVVFAKPILDADDELEKVVLTSTPTGNPVGIVGRDGKIKTAGFASSFEPFHGFDVGQAHFAPATGITLSENFEGVLFGDFRSIDQIEEEAALEDIAASWKWLNGATLTVATGELPRDVIALLLGHDPWAEVIVGKDTTINGMLGDLVFRPYGPSSPGPIPVPTEGAAEPVDPPQDPCQPGVG